MTRPTPETGSTSAHRNQLSMVAVALFDLCAGAFSMWAAVLHSWLAWAPT